MKHLSLSAAIIAAFALAVGAPAFAGTLGGQSAVQTVTFNGAVTADTCTVAIAGGTAKADSTAQSATITLPTVTTSAFGSAVTAGATAGALPFSVVLAGCPVSLASVQATWTAGTPDANGNLKNTGAAPIDVQMLDSTGAAMNMASPLTQSPVALASGAATLAYTAQYVATASGAAFEAGTVGASATLVLKYQ